MVKFKENSDTVEPCYTYFKFAYKWMKEDERGSKKCCLDVQIILPGK